MQMFNSGLTHSPLSSLGSHSVHHLHLKNPQWYFTFWTFCHGTIIQGHSWLSDFFFLNETYFYV